MDAKGLGYANFVKDGKFASWFTGKESLISQANNQVGAALGTPITWHVAEKEAAVAMQNLLAGEKINGISIVHTPFIP